MSCCASCARGLPCEGSSSSSSSSLDRLLVGWAPTDPTPQASIVGAGLFGELPPELRAADDAFSSVWEAIAPAVPYGGVIDTVHRARRSAMYGSDAATATRPRRAPGRAPARARAPGTAAPAGTVRELQRITRAAARGDDAARAELGELKGRASSGDATARRRWAVAVSVMADDDRRIDALSGRASARR